MEQKQQELKTIQTYDNNAAAWAQTHAAVNDWEDVFEQFTNLLPSGNILEIGCGGGRDAELFIKHEGYTYLGTDASKGMIDVCKKQLPMGDFQHVNVYDLASLNQVFDGFWACAVLLHIPKDRINEALLAISAATKDGAIGMISVKDGNETEFEVRDKDGAHEERLFAYWKKDDFETVLGTNGFSVIDYTYRPVSKRTNWHIFFVRKNLHN